jgi:hypothetical protein
MGGTAIDFSPQWAGGLFFIPKIIVSIIKGGYMRYSISDASEYGDYLVGDRKVIQINFVLCNI